MVDRPQVTNRPVKSTPGPRGGLVRKLTEVHRFAEPWEKDASLGLRGGDTSMDREYVDHGRVRDGGQAEMRAAARSTARLADHTAGKGALLISPDNATELTATETIRREQDRQERLPVLVDVHARVHGRR